MHILIMKLFAAFSLFQGPTPVKEQCDCTCSAILLRVAGAGLGRKSVACILLLTLRAHDFPVDTNVGRICARLGWLPFSQEKPLEVPCSMTYLGHAPETFPMIVTCTLANAQLQTLGRGPLIRHVNPTRWPARPRLT